MTKPKRVILEKPRLKRPRLMAPYRYLVPGQGIVVQQRLPPVTNPKGGPELTSDDLYLYSKLKGAPSVVDAVRRASAGELAAARSLFRLISCGVITISP